MFSSLTALTLVFVENAGLALLAPVLILRLGLNVIDFNIDNPYGFWPHTNLQAFHGHQYPILLPNHTSLFGVVGLFFALLVFGLFALRRWKTAAFLAGIFPWIHFFMSLAVFAGAGLAFCLKPDELKARKKEVLKFFSAGTALSIAGILVHKLFISPPVDSSRAAESVPIIAAYKKSWDYFQYTDAATAARTLEIDFYIVAFIIFLWLFQKSNLSEGAKFLIRAIAAITAIGATFMLWTVLSIDSQPLFIQKFMPARWLNLNSMLFPVLVFGVLGCYGIIKRNPLALIFLALNSLFIVFSLTDSLTGNMHLELQVSEPTGWTAVSGYLFPLFGGAAALGVIWLHPFMKKKGWVISENVRYFKLAVNVAFGALIVFCLIAFVFPRYSSERAKGRDIWSPLTEHLSKGTGLLIVPEEMWLRPQLRTRRGVLLDTCNLDILPYAADAAPAVEKIMNRVYRSSLLKPYRGDYLINTYETWGGRSTEEWQALGREFGATSVIPPLNMKLALPLEFVSPMGVVVYRIPQP
ncbi:hypothetical protein EPN96_03600 [bacterium]|nr:MAG: hypothetical protein EPN96_03600 [bacterium]